MTRYAMRPIGFEPTDTHETNFFTADVRGSTRINADEKSNSLPANEQKEHHEHR